MKTPSGLQPLIDDGVIDEVLRSLKSGKEATVYLVRSGSQVLCAKVYRDMAQRSFQKRVQYQKGRKSRSSRETRAMSKIYEETWAILELHFLTRPHLMSRAQEELAECVDSLMAEGRNEPSMLKDLACRTIQLKYGPAPAHTE